MSGPEQVNGTVTDPFQARFGVLAGTQAPEAERQQWEQLCRELLQEREQLRAELAESKAKIGRYMMYLEAFTQHEPIPSVEEMLLLVDQKPTLEELVEELTQKYIGDSGQLDNPAAEQQHVAEQE